MIDTTFHETSETESVSRSAGQVAHDVATLAELQIQLFRSDLQEATERFVQPCAVLAAAAVLLVMTIPVWLIMMSLGLIALGLSAGWAYFLVALASTIIAIVLGLWAWKRFKGRPSAFERSREELVRNLTLILRQLDGILRGHNRQHDTTAPRILEP